MSAKRRGTNIESVVQKIAPEMEAAFKARDVAKLASMYAERAILMPPNQEIVKGRAAIKCWFREPMKRPAGIKIVPTQTSVYRDEAYQVGTFESTVQGAESANPYKSKYALILKRVRARWLVTHDIWNSDQPTPPAAG
jgi:ketosteroid isomerase-like protein